MIEVEIKAKIKDPEHIRKLIEKNKGVYRLSLIHDDTYYNMPKGLRDFKQTDEALRIRKSVEFKKDNKANNSTTNYFITYKGKKVDNTTKTREEIEIQISEIEGMKNLLTNLGFREVFTVVKERDLYEFIFHDKKIEALIDYVPILEQHFIEVELITESLDNVEQNKEILFNFLNSLEIMREESIRKSYLEIISDKLKKGLT